MRKAVSKYHSSKVFPLQNYQIITNLCNITFEKLSQKLEILFGTKLIIWRWFVGWFLKAETSHCEPYIQPKKHIWMWLISQGYAHITQVCLKMYIIVFKYIYLFIKALQHECWRSAGHRVLRPAKDVEFRTVCLKSCRQEKKIHDAPRQPQTCSHPIYMPKFA